MTNMDLLIFIIRTFAAFIYFNLAYALHAFLLRFMKPKTAVISVAIVFLSLFLLIHIDVLMYFAILNIGYGAIQIAIMTSIVVFLVLFTNSIPRVVFSTEKVVITLVLGLLLFTIFIFIVDDTHVPRDATP